MMTEREILQKKDQIKQILLSGVGLFADNSPAGILERKKSCEHDLELFGKTYLPHYFTSPPAQFHLEFDKIIDLKRDKDIVVLIAPPEHAKTVRWGMAYVLQQILYRQRRFIVIIIETANQAEAVTTEIQALLESNLRIINDFGDMQNPGNWTHSDFLTTNGVRVLAAGYKQSIRGIRNGPHRPDLVIVDDLSDYKSARNELLEQEKVDWVTGELYGRIGSNATLFWMGNYIRKSSAIAQFQRRIEKEQLDVYCKRLAAVMPDGSILWARYNHKHQEKIRKTIGNRMYQSEQQQVDVFGGRWYKAEFFRPFTDQEAKALWPRMHKRLIYIDPAFGGKKRTARKRGSDFAILLVAGMNDKGFWLFDAIVAQITALQTGSELAKLFRKWDPPSVRYEGTFGQDRIVGDFLSFTEENEGLLFPRKAFFQFDPKDERITSMSRHAEMGRFWFNEDNEACWKVLENLCDYPDVDYDDPADAWVSAVKILNSSSGELQAKFIR